MDRHWTFPLRNRVNLSDICWKWGRGMLVGIVAFIFGVLLSLTESKITNLFYALGAALILMAGHVLWEALHVPSKMQAELDSSNKQIVELAEGLSTQYKRNLEFLKNLEAQFLACKDKWRLEQWPSGHERDLYLVKNYWGAVRFEWKECEIEVFSLLKKWMAYGRFAGIPSEQERFPDLIEAIRQAQNSLSGLIRSKEDSTHAAKKALESARGTTS